MQSIKSSIFLCITLSMLVFTGEFVWGHPFIETSSAPPPVSAQEQQQPKQESAKATTFTGTVVRDGELFVLHVTSGGVYKLDDSERASSFEGKAVTVTGHLDEDARLIHVDSIEEVKG